MNKRTFQFLFPFVVFTNLWLYIPFLFAMFSPAASASTISRSSSSSSSGSSLSTPKPAMVTNSETQNSRAPYYSQRSAAAAVPYYARTSRTGRPSQVVETGTTRTRRGVPYYAQRPSIITVDPSPTPSNNSNLTLTSESVPYYAKPQKLTPFLRVNDSTLITSLHNLNMHLTDTCAVNVSYTMREGQTVDYQQLLRMILHFIWLNDEPLPLFQELSYILSNKHFNSLDHPQNIHLSLINLITEKLWEYPAIMDSITKLMVTNINLVQGIVRSPMIREQVLRELTLQEKYTVFAQYKPEDVSLLVVHPNFNTFLTGFNATILYNAFIQQDILQRQTFMIRAFTNTTLIRSMDDTAFVKLPAALRPQSRIRVGRIISTTFNSNDYQKFIHRVLRPGTLGFLCEPPYFRPSVKHPCIMRALYEFGLTQADLADYITATEARRRSVEILAVNHRNEAGTGKGTLQLRSWYCQDFDDENIDWDTFLNPPRCRPYKLLPIRDTQCIDVHLGEPFESVSSTSSSIVVIDKDEF